LTYPISAIARQALASLAMLLLAAGAQATQGAPSAREASAVCAAFAPNANGGVQVTGVSFETASDMRRSVCVVRGRIVSTPTSAIHFRVDLPAADRWNTKLLAVGGGGFDGVVPTESPAGLWFSVLLGPDAERAGAYAIVSSDSGHQGRGESPITDFSWAANNPAAVRNHAYEANHRALLAATGLVRQFYGKAPSRRYIIGGSNGGRAGLVAAQRYPADYDGVIALEPAISQEGFAANLVPEMLHHIFSSPDNWMNEAEIQLYERAELDACDALDGLADGILGNLRACHYDGQPLRCKEGERDSDTCLMEGQLESVRRILADKQTPVTLADGVVGYPGYGRGAQSQDWPRYIFGPSFASRTAANYLLADNIVKHGITNDPNASVMTHDPTKWAPQYLALSSEIDATNPDLSAFHARGGRLIVWFGLSDYCVTYRRTADYLDTVRAKMGPKTKEFIRFYTSPAMGHSMSGPGASTMPLLSALEQWVEDGKEPTAIVATLSDGSAAPGATRPLCEYPAFPRYTGQGDPNAASSFICASD
jgi:feruloyl esterase